MVISSAVFEIFSGSQVKNIWGVKENILALKENLSNFYLTVILNVQILFNQKTILFSSNYSFKIIKLILKIIISWVIHGPNT